MARKASDLLDMYVGGSEKNLAAAFSEAKKRGAILLIDEADSYLASREGAHRSWEISQVNELLVQMEQYDGILVMATNQMRIIDSAALRRFDFKIRFDYLQTDQAVRFASKLLHVAQCEPDISALRAALLNLELAPGDFNVVARKAKILCQPLDQNALLSGLAIEHQVRQARSGRSIGFLAAG